MNVLEKILEEIENLNYYPDGMGCGIEDCCITDRYEACEYGWNKAIEAVIEAINNMSETISEMETVKNDGWISVEERLPEANEIVLVTVHSSEWISDFDTSFVPEEEKKFHPERYDVFVGCLRENREWIFFDESMSETSCEKEFGNDKGYIYSVVSAWCPFPEPYKPK